eukprot:gnl/Spiro4/5987_TR3067_c0_g1_i1.p1 gnl/Spiro4/5987_TR3067_c0_g1~~gnl/Spiro4/5987_TR3067_c0_g1_i1.p1  ORF type:complete len:369 (-),score=87.67 gnl/Spiro4/5987_TR3067_c0_g1_i1:70-1122(-)
MAEEQFMAITQCDRSQAQFFLSAANGDITAAIDMFMAGDSRHSPVPASRLARPPAAAVPVPAAPLPGTAHPPPRPAAKKSRVMGFSDLARDEDKDTEPSQEWYTGGEKSGMVVQDPKKKVDNIIEKARKGGEDYVPPPRPEASAFHGTGYSLGSSSMTSVAHVTPVPKQQAVRKITFWRNGFQVDEGPLRAYDDPANAQFVDDVDHGHCPRELEVGATEDVHIDVQDRKREDYKAPVVPRPAFTGTGHTLSGQSPAAPKVVSAASVAAAPVTLDSSRPITTCQIRFADGTRLTQPFNHFHTIDHVRDFVARSCPSVRTFTLLAGFPPKPVSGSATLADAGLLSAVFTQKV